jgi:hypothetical protein
MGEVIPEVDFEAGSRAVRAITAETGRWMRENRLRCELYRQAHSYERLKKAFAENLYYRLELPTTPQSSSSRYTTNQPNSV